jgi:hypothetical protein
MNLSCCSPFGFVCHFYRSYIQTPSMKPKINFAIFKSFWVRKLIGKLGVPYNRRLRVRGSPHLHDYDCDLSLAAAESNAFRIHSDLACSVRRMASLIVLLSSGETRAIIKMPRFLAFGTVGLPIFGFIKYFVYNENNC